MRSVAKRKWLGLFALVVLVAGFGAYRAYVRLERGSEKFVLAEMTAADERTVRDQVAIVAAQFRAPTTVSVKLERRNENDGLWIGIVEGTGSKAEMFERVRQVVRPDWTRGVDEGPIGILLDRAEVIEFRFETIASTTRVTVSGEVKRLSNK
jgi:hypothetical protein